MRIDLHPRFRRRVQALGEKDRALVAAVLRDLGDGFGAPHLHSGLGIRRLRKDLFECRAGLKRRVVFFAEKGLITAYDLMTHDEIRDWLRGF